MPVAGEQTLPGSYQQQLRDLEKRRMLAQLLSQQGSSLLQPSQGRFTVAPSSGAAILGGLGQALGGYMGGKNIAAEGALKDQRAKELAAQLAQMAGGPTAPAPANGALPPAASPKPVMGFPAPPPTGVDPRQQKVAAALQMLQGLPVEVQEKMLAEQALKQTFPDPEAGFTLARGQTRYDATGREIASQAPDEKLPTGMRRNAQGQLEYIPEYLEGQKQLRSAGATNVSVNAAQKYPNAFQEALGKSDVEQLDTFRKAAVGASGMVKTLNQLDRLNPTAMSGGGAETRAQIANWLSGWTGVDVVDPAVLADTQQYNAIVSKSILDSLGGSLGAGVSNADVSFIRNTVPKLEYSEEARQQLIEYLRKRAADSINTYNRAREFGEQHGGLKGFDFMPQESDAADINALIDRYRTKAP